MYLTSCLHHQNQQKLLHEQDMKLYAKMPKMIKKQCVLVF